MLVAQGKRGVPVLWGREVQPRVVRVLAGMVLAGTTCRDELGEKETTTGRKRRYIVRLGQESMNSRNIEAGMGSVVFRMKKYREIAT